MKQLGLLHFYMIKKIIFTICVTLTLVFPVFAEKEGADKPVRVGVELSYPPYSLQDANGTASGFNVEITRAVARVMGMEITIVQKPWEEVRKALERGDVDIVTGMFYTEDRALIYDFSPPFSIFGYSIFTRNDSPPADSLEDLRNKEIVVIRGDVMHDYLIKHIFTEKILFTDNTEEAIKLFADGKGDFLLSGKIPGLYWVKKMNIKNITALEPNLEAYKQCFAVRKGDSQLLMNFSEGLNILNYTGEYHEIYDRWLTMVHKENFYRQKIFKYILIVFASLLFAIFILLLFTSVLRRKVDKATRDLRASESRFQAFMNETPVFAYIKDKTLKHIYMNRRISELAGIKNSDSGESAGKIFGQKVADILESADRRILSGEIQREEIEFKYFLKDEIRWVYDIKFALEMSEEQIGVGGLAFDITERKKAEEKIKSLLAEKELLLKEVHHRIKNNMNTIKGLLTLQIFSEENPDTEASLRSAESRVHSMIMLYDRLYCTDNYRELSVKEYLEPLTEEIVGSFTGNVKVKIETEIDDFILNVRLLSPLGIIVNEVLTNIMKYAFSGRDSGIISLSAGVENNSGKVVIRDNGVGIPDSIDFGRSTGFGLDLVKMLTEQISGTISIERGAGTGFVLEFPL